MAEYIPVYMDGDVPNSVASADITGGQVLVASGEGTVAPAGAASAAVVGVATNDAKSGDRVAYFKRGSGVHELTASAAIVAGAVVESAATGRVATHTEGTNDGRIIGVALTSAAAAGDTLTVQF